MYVRESMSGGFRTLAWLFRMVFLAGLACSCRGTTHAPERREVVPSAPAGAVSATQPRVFETRGWDLDKRYTYRMKLSTSVTFAAGPPSFDFDLDGRLAVETVSASPDLVELYLSVAEVTLQNRVATSQVELDELRVELGRSGAFVSLAGGRMRSLAVPPGMSELAVGTYRQLGAALQFAAAERGAQRYTAEEYDSTGKYVAEYELSADRTWRKQKQRYLSLLAAQSLPGSSELGILPDVASSRGEVRLAPEGWPEDVKLVDVLRLKGTQTPLRSTAALELTDSRVERPQIRDIPSLRAKARPIAADKPLGTPAPARSLDKARIAGLDFETIVAELEQRQVARDESAKLRDDDGALEAAAATNEDEVRVDSRRFVALAALLRSDARSVAKAVAKIKAQSAATADLLDALSSAASPEAQRALVALAGSKGIGQDLRKHVVFSLARTPKPSREAALALKTVLKDEPFHAGALYGLGTYARLYRDLGQHAEAREIGEFLLSRFALARGPTSLVVLLRAIANSGYDGAFPEVMRRLEDQREEVRAASLRALQSMRNSPVEGVVSGHLRRDEPRQVQIAALETAKIRGPTEPLASALEHAAMHATDTHVRYRAVELLIRWLPQRPSLRPALERIARDDSEESVRDRAQAAL
jgi:hypothetical protein